MNIDWAALGQVFGVSLVVTVGDRGPVHPRHRRHVPQAAAGRRRGALAVPGTGARAGACACFALCAAAVAYGIYLIVAA